MSMHARLSASSAHRWMRCPGSVTAQAGYPDETNEYAEEGTLLHAASEVCLRLDIDATPDAISEATRDDPTEPGHRVTEEQCEYIQYYVDYVREHTTGADYVAYEVLVSYDAWVPGGFGTSDVVAIHRDGSVDVIDAKFGRRQVEAHGNDQLQLYALGVLQEYSALFEMARFRLHIVQPRLDNVDVWEVSIAELEAFGHIASTAASLVDLPNPTRIAGEKQCYWCKARFDCAERDAMARWVVEEEFADIEEPETDPRLALALDFVPFVRRWADDMDAAARARLLRGGKIQGWKIVEGRSARKWVDREAVETALARGKYRIGDTHDKVLKGVPAIEKLLGKEAFEKRLGQLVHKPPGKPVLVTEGNPKPALEFASAADEFETEESEDAE